MAKLIIEDRRCRIENEDDQGVLWALDNKVLSFNVQGAQYSRVFKHGYMDHFTGEYVNWDGKERLLEESNLSFPIGLKQRVIDFYNTTGSGIEVVDKRSPKSAGRAINILPILKSMNKMPRPYQLDAMKACRNEDCGIIRIPTGGGKCNCVDSLNITSEGILTYKELIDVELQDQEAINFNINVATPLTYNGTDKSSMIYHDGISNSIEIHTNYGHNLIATKDHKIKILNNDGKLIWKKFQDLIVGDIAVINYNTQMFGTNIINNNDAYWFGLLLGDGSLTLKHRVEFINKDPHLLNFAKEYIVNNDLPLNIRKDKNTYKIRIFNTEYRDKLFNMGFAYSKATNKEIPLFIRKSNKLSQSMVLRGLFETDGWVNTSINAIGIGLANKKMITQIKLMLLNYGIVSSLSIKKDNRKDSYSDYYVLTIFNEFVGTFIDQIGFDPNGYKYKLCHKITKCNISKKNTIPYIDKQLDNIVQFGINKFGTKKEFFKSCPIHQATIYRWCNGKSFPPINRLKEFLLWANERLQKSNCDIDNIFNLCNNLFFDKIVDITTVISDNYDFVIPKSHSFISQGFINHNTLVSSLITADIGKKTLILVIGKDLLYQTQKFYENIFQQPIGIIGDGHCDIQDITIASVWTIGLALGLKHNSIIIENDDECNIDDSKYKQIKDLLSCVKLVILDECHVSACDTIQELNKHINPEHIYGMSASPWRDDGADLLIESILGSKIVDISATQLIKDGYLVQPIIKFIRVPEYEKRLKKNYQSIYKTYICENKVRNDLVVSYTEKLVNLGYKPLVLYNSVNHGKILRDLISKKVSCTLLSGKDKMGIREQAKQDIENGKVKAIIASKIFDIGVDIPALSGLVVAGSGKSSVRALQRIGRVIRPYPGKKQAAVVDFIDQAHYVKKHSQARKEIYSLEEGFDVRWPKN